MIQIKVQPCTTTEKDYSHSAIVRTNIHFQYNIFNEFPDILEASFTDTSRGIQNKGYISGGDVVPAVAALSEANIFQVYSVGVDNAALDQLNLIASSNSDYVYYHSQFTETSLVVIGEKIIERLRGSYILHIYFKCKCM